MNLKVLPPGISTGLQKEDAGFSVTLFKHLRINIPVVITHNLDIYKAITLPQQIITYYTCAMITRVYD